MSASAKNLDSPARWKVSEQFEDAVLWGAFNGVFNLKEDAKARTAFADNKLDIVKKITQKRIREIGSKPKFKKLPKNKLGYRAYTVKGSRAHALMLYEQKMWGKTIRPKIAKSVKKKKKEVVKKEKSVPPVPNLSLSQNRAYTHARKHIKSNEILLYVYLKKGDDYVSVYYNKKTKKRRNVVIHLSPSKVKSRVPHSSHLAPEIVEEIQRYIAASEKRRRAAWEEAEKYRKSNEITWSILPDRKGRYIALYKNRKGKSRGKILSTKALDRKKDSW